MNIHVGNHPIKALMLGTAQVTLVFRGTLQVWSHEALSVLSAGTNDWVIKDLFTPEIWASDKPKRVLVPEGVEITGVHDYCITVAPDADPVAESYGGPLTIDVRGVLSGKGGLENSGEGGHCIRVNVTGRHGQKALIRVFGTLRSGGGGGGRGGVGGGGSQTSSYSQGPYYGPDYSWRVYYDDYSTGRWWNGWWANNGGGITYWAGAWKDAGGGVGYYEIGRTVTTTVNTDGGVGGAGGGGQGADRMPVEGSVGAPGGTNAGAGGTGGTGGGWGQQGSVGASGVAGNRTAGAAGAAGGLPGAYIQGSANSTIEIYGTVLGRLL